MDAVRCYTLDFFPENILIDILSYLNVRELVRNSRYNIASCHTITVLVTRECNSVSDSVCFVLFFIAYNVFIELIYVMMIM